MVGVSCLMLNGHQLPVTQHPIPYVSFFLYLSICQVLAKKKTKVYVYFAKAKSVSEVALTRFLQTSPLHLP